MSTPYGTGKRGVAILPLTLIVVLHLILVLLWATNGRTRTDQAAEQRYFSVTWLPAPRPRAEPPPVPTAAAAAAPRTVRAAAAAASRSEPQLAPPGKVEPSVQEELAPRSSAPTAVTPDALDVKQMIDTAKRQAGMIDRELRGGKLAALRPDSELPIARLRSALEGAYNDRSSSVIMDTLTQADGVVVYRFRHRGKVWCRQSGGGGSSAIEYSEGAKLAGAGSRGGAGVAGHVQCPSGESGWSRR